MLLIVLGLNVWDSFFFFVKGMYKSGIALSQFEMNFIYYVDVLPFFCCVFIIIILFCLISAGLEFLIISFFLPLISFLFYCLYLMFHFRLVIHSAKRREAKDYLRLVLCRLFVSDCIFSYSWERFFLCCLLLFHYVCEICCVLLGFFWLVIGRWRHWITLIIIAGPALTLL